MSAFISRSLLFWERAACARNLSACRRNSSGGSTQIAAVVETGRINTGRKPRGDGEFSGGTLVGLAVKHAESMAGLRDGGNRRLQAALLWVSGRSCFPDPSGGGGTQVNHTFDPRRCRCPLSILNSSMQSWLQLRPRSPDHTSAFAVLSNSSAWPRGCTASRAPPSASHLGRGRQPARVRLSLHTGGVRFLGFCCVKKVKKKKNAIRGEKRQGRHGPA